MRRIAKSVTHAWSGLKTAFREEKNMQVHGLIGLVVLVMAWYFQITSTEWLVLIMVMALVFSLEIVNSIIERLIDIIKPSVNQYVKEMKDMIAGGVLLAALAAVVVGLIIFLPRILGTF